MPRERSRSRPTRTVPEQHRRIAPVALLSVVVLLTGACTSGRAPEHQFDRFVVAADHPAASEAGAEILRLGGNAVDAAVATSFALSVVRPSSCGIGGGGFMVIHLADDPRTREPNDALDVAIDYRERAPSAITPTHYESLPDGASRFGAHAVAIPGTVAGLLHALETYGTLDRASVLAPAIRIANRGYVADAHAYEAARTLQAFLDEHADWPGEEFLRNTFIPDERYFGGDVLRNPRQAAALELIARHGRAGFYDGPIADAIVEAIRAGGGILSHADLASYRPTETTPLVGRAFGRTFLAMPLPSSGGICLLQILMMLEDRPDLLASVEPGSPAYAHLVIEMMKHAFADRARHLGDPEFVEVDVERLLDPAYLRARAATVEMDRTHDPSHYGIEGRFPVDAGTSHLSVVDQWGNAVACTETINLEFGSRLPVADYGFLLNDEMDDFLTRRGEANAFGLTQSERNLPAPGKRPLSSMSPTIVLDPDGRVEAVAGASGGPRIITGTLQAILNVILWDQSAERAVGAPRFHHQWEPNAAYLEPALMRDEAFVAGLRERGHEVREGEDIGNVQLIRRAPDGARWEAASDPRKGGEPAGQ